MHNEPTQQAGEPSTTNPAPHPRPGKAHYWWALLGAVGGIIGFVQLKDRDRSMAWKVLSAGVAVALVITAAVTTFAVTGLGVLSAGSSAPGASVVDPANGPLPEPAELTPDTPAPTIQIDGMRGLFSFAARAVYTVDYATGNGYTARATWGVGQVFRPTDLTFDPAVDPTQVCALDPQADAVIPYALEVVNTTANFEQQVRAGLYSPDSSDGEISIMRALDSGPLCNMWGDAVDESNAYFDALSVESPDALPPDGWISLRGYIVLPDYFSPTAPQGDSARLARMAAEASVVPYADPGPKFYPVVGCSGPGVTVSGSTNMRCVLPWGTQL